MKANDFKQLAFILGLLFSIAACDNAGRNTTADRTMVNDSLLTESKEKDFVTDVLEVSAEKMVLLKEAANKATDKELKSQAEQMMNEYKKMETDLKTYASKKNIETDDIDTTETVILNERPATEWDEECADEIADKDRQLVRRFERAQKRIEDDDLKNMIATHLPTLRSRLEMTEKLETRLEDQP
jgi:predicted outer membrane protein